MKRFALTILIAAAFVCTANAQDTKPRTNSGDKALQFSFNGFGDFGVGGARAGSVPFTLLGFDSLFTGFRISQPIVGFGMKYFLSDNVALRGAVGLGSSTASTPRAGDTTGKTDDVKDLILGITPGLEFHLVKTGPVTAYTGVFVSYSHSSNTTGDPDDTLRSTTTKSYNSIGGGAIFGVEYFPWSAISFGAEYQLGVLSSSSSSENKGKTTDGKSYLDIGIGAFAVMLGVYF